MKPRMLKIFTAYFLSLIMALVAFPIQVSARQTVVTQVPVWLGDCPRTFNLRLDLGASTNYWVGWFIAAQNEYVPGWSRGVFSKMKM